MLRPVLLDRWLRRGRTRPTRRRGRRAAGPRGRESARRARQNGRAVLLQRGRARPRPAAATRQGRRLQGRRSRLRALRQWSPRRRAAPRDRQSDVEGKSVSVSTDLGGRRIIKQKHTYKNNNYEAHTR